MYNYNLPSIYRMPKQTTEFKQAQEDLAKRIRDNRPGITDSSIRTYVSLLSNLYYREHSRDTHMDMSFFKNDAKLLELLKDKTPQSRKTVLAAIVVLNGKDADNATLSKQMTSDMKHTENELINQEKTEKQQDNWVDYGEVTQLQKGYETKALEILAQKKKPDEVEKEFLAKYMIITLSSGVYFPPRRSEMVHIKVKDIDEENDNYIDMSANEFVYNQYKTVKKYGQQRVKFPATFKAILKKYLSKLSDQTYLVEHMGKPYGVNQVTRTLYQMFGKKVSTSMLRHIFLSSVYENVPALKEMTERAKDMGQSVSMALQYVKR